MAVLTVHHWGAEQEAGVRELRRVSRGPVLIVTFDIEITAQMWLYRDYLPESAELDRATFPQNDQLVTWLGGSAEVQTVGIPRDTPDWTAASFWAHPERVLDEQARSSTSAFALMEPEVVGRVVTEVERDLRLGTWAQRNRHLQDLPELDVGMRIIVAHP